MGACMIGGFPHRSEDSFFHHAIQRLRPETECRVVDSIYTFGGFPITRVPKHLAARCLNIRPHIVVMQFASSDLVVPVRRQPDRHNHGHGGRPVHHVVTVDPPKSADVWRWRLQGLLGDIRQLAPVTPPEAYLQTVQQIVQTLREHEIVPIVVLPFVFGGWRSDRLARQAADQLRSRLQLPSVYQVDAYAALDQHPRQNILLGDGAHLSLFGHQVVAEALYPVLKQAVQQWQSRTNKD